MKMASLLGTPPELIGGVCSSLSAGDILSLCRSCKTLYSAAHPLLFRHITFVRAFPRRFISLLLFVLRNPCYAEYVKAVDILDFRFFLHETRTHGRSSAKGDPSSLSPGDTALVRAAVEDCCFPDASAWEARIAQGHPGAIIALILAQCTCLVSLDVDQRFIPRENVWFSHLIRVAASGPDGEPRPSVFPRLAHLVGSEPYPISDFRPERELSPEVSILSFYLPSIKTLSFNTALCRPWLRLHGPASITGHESIPWPLGDPPLAVSLTKLLLDFPRPLPRGSIELECLQALLRQTPNLQSLSCSFKLLSSSSPLDPSALQQALGQVRGTLTHLVVMFEVLYDEEDWQISDYLGAYQSVVDTTWHGFGHLGWLSALEELEIPLAMLFGNKAPGAAPPLAEVLPRGLRRLVIVDSLVFGDGLWDHLFKHNAAELAFWEAEPDASHKWPAESVAALLEAFFGGACRTATPLLEEFVLDVRQSLDMSPKYQADEGRLEGIRRLAESQGIRCSIHVKSRRYSDFHPDYAKEREV